MPPDRPELPRRKALSVDDYVEGVRAGDVVSMNLYPLSARVAEMARKVRGLKGAVIPFEGVASIDGSFAIDAVAIAK